MATTIRNKKSQLNDFVTFTIIIVTIALTILLGKYALYKIHEGFSSAGTDVMSTTTAALVNQSFNTFESNWQIFDSSIIFIVIGLTIGLIISSFLIPVHPIFLVINIIGLIFLVFFGAVLSNLYFEIASTEPISNYSSLGGELSQTGYVMQYLPFICAFVILIVTIVMYGKSRNG